MRAAMCFSHFQLPRCQIHTLYGSWWKKLNTFTQSQQYISNSRLLRSNIHNLQGGRHSRRWTQKSVSTNIGKDALSRKIVNISQQITNVSSLTHNNNNLNTSRVELGECKSVHIEDRISENKDTSKNITVIVFDIETTGFRRDADRIIEIALQDLSGGENSTFQTLVNPNMIVTNTEIHGITSSMLNKNGVPRMQELIPILIQYVKSRQKPGGQILLVGHNAKSFDVPFLMHEFNRCSYEIPSDWRFMDSLTPGRKIKDLKKPEGATRLSRSLQNLREHYEIPRVGSAHRAMSDVKSLALVLQKMTCELKLTVSCLENYSFTVSDIINNSNSKKKKNSG
ncbi:exonuclease DPD1, chloroplastic/mitochondrial-like [Bidens hawaiensis]|uniref:exonuclease DPD1, chloroplastic/mitochondrial-like n=1 Tax=Bidens hawaiensis TaxID=980011 RepID=UPI00404B52DD